MSKVSLIDNVSENIVDDVSEKILDTRPYWNTRVIFTNPYTGKELYNARNKLILPGSGLIAHKVFDIGSSNTMDDTPEEAEITPSYNSKIPGIINPISSVPATLAESYTKATVNDKKILLFCVGTDGCGAESSQVYSVNYKKWCNYTNLIPFRYVDNSEDVNINRSLYFGKALLNGMNAYYFKRFNDFNTGNFGVIFKQVYENGTNINSNVYDNTSPEEIYTYVELHMSITEEDCVDYIRLTNGSNKVNTIQLCTCYPVMGIDNNLYMNDIRPITKLNFSNELLSNNKAIDITYQIYF